MHDRVTDGVLDELEKLAREVDRLAAADDPSTSAKRQRLLIELDVAGLLAGTPAIAGRVADRPTLRGYHDACVAMASYHRSAARERLVGTPIPIQPSQGRVALDWFRTPSGERPPDVPEHDWIALCERNFSDPMPTGTGTRFVRLEGRIHVLSFRVEIGPEPKLWRAAPEPKAQRGREGGRREHEEPETTGQVTPAQGIGRALAELAATIERMAAETLPFEPVDVALTIRGRKALLRYAPSPTRPAKRYVELVMYSESGMSTSSQWLESGANEALVRWLRRPAAIPETLGTADELVTSLARNGLA